MIVRFTAAAKADIQSIYDYITRENPIAAIRVVSTIEIATRQLAQFPLSGREGAVEHTRELVIPRLPYIVVYQVTAESVDVIAVFHAAQNRPRGG
jgi:toxin ParE1/3/4